jgi:hypothetical protein
MVPEIVAVVIWDRRTPWNGEKYNNRARTRKDLAIIQHLQEDNEAVKIDLSTLDPII